MHQIILVLHQTLNRGCAIIVLGGYIQVDMDDVEHITETALTIRGTRRRTTVPKPIVEKIGLKNGDKIRWILFKDGSVVIIKDKR